MGSSSSFAELGGKLSTLGVAIQRLPRTAGPAVGQAGKEAALDLAGRTFGADRRLSGAKRGSLRRPVSARYTVRGDSVIITPTGGAWYLFHQGRSFRVDAVRPRRKRAIVVPGVGPRASANQGAMRARPNLMDPAVRDIAREAPKIVDRAVQNEIRKVF